MCERNCIYSGGSGNGCDYCSAAKRTNAELTTRLGILCKRLEKPSHDPEIMALMQPEHCPFYEYNGRGKISETLPVEVKPEKQGKKYTPPCEERLLLLEYNKGLLDSGIGRACGISAESVRLWRKERGLQSNYVRLRPKLDEERAQELYDQGLNDREIAEALGTTINIIWAWRDRYALPSKRHPVLDDEGKAKRLKMYLAGYSDKQIADALKTTMTSVRSWRNKNKLKANKFRALRDIPVDKDQLRRLYYKGLRDEEIAERAGCSISTVRRWRKFKGLEVNGDKRKKEHKK